MDLPDLSNVADVDTWLRSPVLGQKFVLFERTHHGVSLVERVIPVPDEWTWEDVRAAVESCPYSYTLDERKARTKAADLELSGLAQHGWTNWWLVRVDMCPHCNGDAYLDDEDLIRCADDLYVFTNVKEMTR